MLPDRHGGDLADREYPTATLVVADWSSSCSACSGNADPVQAHHVSGGMPLTLGAGCKARFVAIATHRDSRSSDDQTKAMRRDLPYTGRWT